MDARQLRRIVHYNADTGVFTNVLARQNCPAGKVLGGLIPSGYLRAVVFQRHYLLHRLAWLYVTGTWPRRFIDHIDGDKTNNRFRNLREADDATNNQNRRAANKSSLTGFLGVTLCRQTQRYRAVIMHKRKSIHLGRFETPEEAHAAYVTAKRLLHSAGML